jgi:Spy/CpxP family protein refolding chaperone
MKKGKNVMIALFAILMMGFVSSDLMAQKAEKMKKKDKKQTTCLPGMTDEQHAKIAGVKTKYWKQAQPVKDQMRIKHAELKALNNGDNVDLNAVNAKIDEIAAHQAKLMKMKASHRQDVRKMLTEQQKVLFDQAGLNIGDGHRDRDRRFGNRQNDFGHGRNPYRNHPIWSAGEEELE